MPNISGPFLPTPASSLRSQKSPFGGLDSHVAGPSRAGGLYTDPSRLPPTPPHPSELGHTDRMYTPPPSDYAETRYRSAKIDAARRPHSTYPTTEDPIYHPHRKYTDPTPHSSFGVPEHQHSPHPQPPSPMLSGGNHQLDVDLDVYSQDYNELEDEMRQPTLSFVTTSTVDSTTSSPSITDAYTYGTEHVVADGKGPSPELEPRIRMRTGRQNAYSSAESSMVSGAYSYHAYSEYGHQQPPMPPMPADMGLGLSQANPYSSTNDDASSQSCQAVSPSSQYTPQQPWRSPVPNRDRSYSISTSATDPSEADEQRLSANFANSFSYLSQSFPSRQVWDDSEVLAEPNALAMIDDGRSLILDSEKLEAMGGVERLAAMSESDLLRLPRFTHLLLSGVGPHILHALSPLLDVLSTTLVVLDISNNNLTELPPALCYCAVLEELNVSSNPLGALPAFLGDCMSLRMLAVDNCILQSLPVELSQLRALHTLCIRSNRLMVLPAWLCLLAHLEALRIDNNPFAPQWVPIVSPILAATLARRHSRTPSGASIVRPGSSMSSHNVNSIMSSLNPSQSSVGGTSASNDSLSTGQPARNPMFASLRTTQPIGKRAESPVPMRAPNRSVSNPNPNSEVLMSRNSGSGAGSSRRVQSAAHYMNDEGDLVEEKGTNPKWGFLRKVSLSRLRTEKDRSAQLNASAAANISSMPSGPVISSPTLVGGPPPKRPPLNAGWSTGAIGMRPRAESQGSIDLSMTAAVTGSSMSVPKMRNNKRRSFLPIDPSPPSLNVAIPNTSPFMAAQAQMADPEHPKCLSPEDIVETLGDDESSMGHMTSSTHQSLYSDNMSINDSDGRYQRGLDSIKSYLRDLFDLSLPPREPYGGFEVIDSATETLSPTGDQSTLRDSVAESTSSARHLGVGTISRGVSMVSVGSERHSAYSSAAGSGGAGADTPSADSPTPSKRFKDDKGKRARVVREIYETEKTYVRGLEELVQIYVRPASMPSSSSKGETVIPVAERKVVFGGVESILLFHRDNFLPALHRVVQPLIDGGDDETGEVSARTAHQVGEVFRTYIAYMKQYSTYINNFDNALSRMKSWVGPTGASGSPVAKNGAIGVAAVGASLVGSAVMPVGETGQHSGSHLTPNQRKRVKTFLKRCKVNPKHSQISLESYLLLPVQRVPRYKLLLDDLAMCTPPRETIGPNDALDDAIYEIATLASLMNEEKREAESRLRLLHWQQRITSRGPSPLVQPHRKLILDGALTLIRVVKKSSSYVEVDMAAQLGDGEATITGSKAVVPVEYIKPEPMDKPIMLILCSDMLVLVQKRSGEGWEGAVDLFSVLRMATLREPASVSSSNERVLRVVDNRSIYYFNGGSHETTLQWCRAINGQNRR